MNDNQVNNAEQGMEKYFFRASADDFKKIPGSPIAYWVSDKWFSVFSKNKILGEASFASEGVKTGNNELFLRLWHEVKHSDFGSLFDCNPKWIFHHKGGEFRKWAGNREYIILWENNGRQIKNMPNSGIQGERSFLVNAAIWSDITSGGFSARLKDAGHMFDSASPVGFLLNDGSINNLLAFLNSSIVDYLTPILNPTLHFKVGNFRSLPFDEIQNKSVTELINLAKTDWDSYETSWDFTGLPLLSTDYRQPTLKATYQKLRAHWLEMTLEMQRLEEENNRIFIDAYGLQDELTPEVPLKEITLTCNPHYRYGLSGQWLVASDQQREEELEARLLQDTMQELISYAVGCMFGRYSLDIPGLVLANQGESLEEYSHKHNEGLHWGVSTSENADPKDLLDATVERCSFLPDWDNVIPMLEGEWFADDITERFKQFLKVAFGTEHYEENLRFVEKSLNVKGRRSYSIRDYFLREFYNDHVKRYKKRPIYWLFSSPKGNFNALIYMHRYRPDTVSVVLNDYLREFRTKLTSYKTHLEAVSISAGASQGEKTNALKEIEKNTKIIGELAEYERDVLYPLATEQVEIDLDDGVKVNYPKFSPAVKRIPGLEAKED